MKVAILMAVHNDRPFIEDALHSVLRQSESTELDIVVVNDGSDDGTETVLQDMARAFPEIRVIDTENRGVTRARNRGLEALRPDTDLVTFLDGDDLMADGRIERDCAAFARDPDLAMIYSKLCYFEHSDPGAFVPSSDSRTLVSRSIHLSSGMFRLSLLKGVGLFDEEFEQAEDTDFILRILETSPKYLVSDSIAHYYRRHPGSMTRNRQIAAREFARAMLKATKRRKLLGNYRLPNDIFDVLQDEEAATWI
ncbi:glycosyltransferase family 2 protein [Hoeflea poritis]|uniref:Glycosyltransferase family A protein n=1 Tax=Hoeflea poritis TaxID=2993659 RepID=A0ABT4VH86_9HYPH|nr:glycosyltransferase family A protein [Hoeflea poritis]MDA4844055.1 glycosyltransferase family A protein [Hoeflea poritis]